MTQTYQARRRAQDAPAEQQFHTSVPGPSMQELAAGAMPSTEQMGHRVDLPDAIREKMETSFGADFSGVKLYESQTVADAGAEAMTMGSNVAFAPGQLDLTSTSGQALLGHELSHVVSQARGESAGRGFLADSGLEAQADRQGMLAAQGESVYTGPVAPLSSSAVPASAAGVAQAKKKKTIAEEAYHKDQEVTDAMPSVPLHWGQREEALSMMPAGHEHMDELAQSGYLDLATFKMNQTQDENERQEILNTFLSGDQDRINAYLKNDSTGVLQEMKAASNDLIQEDFQTRADAYGRSAGTRKHLALLEDAGIANLLNEEELAEFQGARENFLMDRYQQHHSLAAAMGWKGDYRETRGKRRKYRNRRRNGTTATEMAARRAEKARLREQERQAELERRSHTTGNYTPEEVREILRERVGIVH